jgi:hypothetical protein
LVLRLVVMVTPLHPGLRLAGANRAALSLTA